MHELWQRIKERLAPSQIIMLRVWLDDLRFPPEEYNVWAKTAEECIAILNTGGVTSLSFDHDLGEGNGTGYDVACWIEKAAFFGRLSKIQWRVHSMNSVGAKNIKAAMRKADQYWSNKN